MSDPAPPQMPPESLGPSPPVEGGPAEDRSAPSADGDLASSATPALSDCGLSTDEPLEEGGLTNKSSASGAGAQKAKTAFSKRSVDKQQEVRTRRAQFDQTYWLQQAMVEQLQSHLQDCQQRTTKQQAYIKNTNEQLFKAEVDKVHYKVRLDNANLRLETLGKQLKQVYEQISELVGDRLKSEKVAIGNHAMVDYLDFLATRDRENAEGFVDNRNALIEVKEKYKKVEDCKDLLEKLQNDLKTREDSTMQVLNAAGTLKNLIQQLAQLWSTIPQDMLDQVLLQGGGTKMVLKQKYWHPDQALRALSEYVVQVSTRAKSILHDLSIGRQERGQEQRVSIVEPVIESQDVAPVVRAPMSERKPEVKKREMFTRSKTLALA